MLDRNIDIRDKNSNEKMYKLLSLIFGLMIIFFSLIDKNYLYFTIGILLIFYSTYNIQIFLSDEGILYFYKNIIFYKKVEYYFKDIDEAVLIDGNVLILIKSNVGKKILINREKVSDITEILRVKLGKKFRVD